MANDPYTDDEYDDTYREVHGDEPTRDEYTDDGATDDTFFPSGVGGSLYPTGWGVWPGGDTVDADYDGTEGEYDGQTARANDDEGSWWDEGLIGALLLVGVVLFLFPEPATSAIGIGLVTIGVIAWLIDWAM
ncbi:hypothetical protein [Halorussus aquaticus]|uniref:TIGR04206 family protein n=1 Tax=Halorussus aquaticus TaxID=2953748 RepID=A0ABD5PZD2_9EURY|nr:hypothetical protein [Halorussus aquaticus]